MKVHPKLFHVWKNYCRVIKRVNRWHLSIKVISITLLISALVFTTGCSLEGFREFKVESINLSNDSVIGTDKSSIEVVFSKEVNKKTVYDSIRVEEEGSSQVSVDLEIDRNRVAIIPVEKWLSHKRYWLVIDKDIEDIYGKKMEKSFYMAFRSTEDAMPVSALIVEPDIQNDTVNEELGELTLAFSGSVDRPSIELAFSISPEAKGRFNWVSDSSFTYVLEKPLQKNSLYTVYISNKGLDQEGNPIREFDRSFEYCSNTPYPEVDTILIDGVMAFDRNNQNSFSLQNDCYYSYINNVGKDSVVRINFTSDIDRESLLSGLEISPSVDWTANWIDDRTVDISFDENLKLEEDYNLRLGKEIKGKDGLSFLYKYLVNARIDGQFSRYLDFYADDFTGILVDASISSGGNPVTTGAVLVGEDSDGYYIKINYNDTPAPEEIDVVLIFTLRFLSSSYSPVIKRGTLQDSVNFSFITGTNPNTSSKTGSIDGFNWTGDNECNLSIGELATDNVYHLQIAGGPDAVEDEYNNYLRDNIDYYFKLIVEHD